MFSSGENWVIWVDSRTVGRVVLSGACIFYIGWVIGVECHF
jgi:hypothetical protein